MLNFLAAIGSAPAGGGGSFESIATASGTGSSDTITFTNIPSTFQHLQVRMIARTTSASATFDEFYIRFNNDIPPTINYSHHTLEGNGSSVTARGAASQNGIYGENFPPRNGNASGIMGAAIIDVHDYASSTKNKTVRCIYGTDLNGSGFIDLHSGLWRSTSPVTSLSIIANGTNFTSNSTFALYGIKGA